MVKKRVKIPVKTAQQDPEPDEREDEVREADEQQGGHVEQPEAGESQATAELESGTTPVDTEALKKEVEQLREELEQARAEAAEYKDRWLRAVAEMENMRKRLEKRFTDEAEREKRRFLRAILPLVDNLEMVIKHSETNPEVLREGVKMIYQDLLRTLQAEGLEPISSVGQKFDPFLHEAVEVVETKEHPEETVVDEVQRGYRYKGELLRPARVRVAKKDGK